MVPICIFNAKQNKYDYNTIIKSNSFAADVYYLFMKNWIKKKRDLLFVTSTEYKTEICIQM